jgi:hypothetical protein
MRTLRRHLRLGVATWLACHVLAFSALLPRNCCAAHAHGPATSASTGADHSAHAGHAMPAALATAHASPGAAESFDGASCPMRGADGAPCPMHESGAAPDACQMTGVCNQPAAALAAVLMQSAVPPAVFVLQPHHAGLMVSPAADVQPLSLALPPDSPPPRL